jgi:hypothetical protein
VLFLFSSRLQVRILRKSFFVIFGVLSACRRADEGLERMGANLSSVIPAFAGMTMDSFFVAKKP